ncbi:MAG: glycoside hydrolase family 5 protein [Candidatus Dormibacteraeota bacterium]|nr:glycoside hydrolase family 5 protein [Candidatus Dormibacteraeota bacterium]
MLCCAAFVPGGETPHGNADGTLRFGADLLHSLPAAAGASGSADGSAPLSGTAGQGRSGGATASHAPAASAHPTASARPPAGAGGSGLVSRNGTSLLLNGTPWQFAGYDDYRLTSASPGHQCGGAQSNADVAAALDEIHNNSGATVVRTWFMQAYGGPGNWSQFDRVLSAAAARGMKVIPVLADQWAACEPWPAGQTPYRALAWYQSGYRAVDYGYGLSYRDYAAAIAAHYRNDPTIAFWQLVNEAEALDGVGGACEDAAANAALRSFADDVAGIIKANDRGHLVSLGTIATGQCGTSSTSDFLNLHSGLIDICEYHDYFGPGGLPGDQWHGVAVRINQCHSLNKPIFAGEVGLQASIASDGSSGGPVTAASLAQRATFFKEKLQAQLGAGVAGFLIWQYATGPRTDNYEIQPGDPTEAVMLRVAATLAGW